MRRLIECVPNFSEGRRTDVIDALAGAIAETPGTHLLDRSSDTDHNRTVLTFAGPPREVADAMERMVAIALKTIDMERHTGQHPRMGAVDVIPFVPLGDTSLDEAVALAGGFAQRIAERFELPVYLYAMAATRPERRILADVRRPQYEGLKSLIAEDPERAPDFGPNRLHATGGAVAVGARPFLIAYNINLASDDVALAKRIAGAVREKGGGLPRVQALGLYLEDLRCAQVSMNLLDHAVTPLWRVWERVRDLAAAEGVELRESELIGLAPLAALLAVADHAAIPSEGTDEERITGAADWLCIRDFEPTKALELRLARAEGGSDA
ncbi:MAG: glutamate formimidoyltransferase [Chloroflexi bacterium]|nr:glutamate formimidoyltransferase [Chloroflexota bacterium]